MPLESKKDLLVYMDTSGLNGGVINMVIRRRNSEGVYEHAANFSTEATSIATNGKWIAALGSNSPALFSIDAANQISNVSAIDCFAGNFLSDDTFVGINVNPDGNFTIQAYEYNASGSNWTALPGTQISTGYIKLQGALSSFRASDTHFVIVDTSVQSDYKIQIYERLADRTYKLEDTVPVNISFDIGSVFYNGVDTLVYSFPLTPIPPSNAQGFVYIYTKINGTWHTQLFTADSIGYGEVAFFGFNVIFADPKTLLISAAYAGYPIGTTSSYDGGKILLLTQNDNGMWEPMADLTASSGLFGVGMVLNDHDLLVTAVTGAYQSTGFPIAFYVAPQCFYQPPSITCKNQEFSECTDIAVEEIFTLNNPQCGSEVVAAMKGFSLVNNNKAIEAHVSVTKSFLPAVYCNATVTCPAASTPTTVSTAITMQYEFILVLLAIFVIA